MKNVINFKEQLTKGAWYIVPDVDAFMARAQWIGEYHSPEGDGVTFQTENNRLIHIPLLKLAEGVYRCVVAEPFPYVVHGTTEQFYFEIDIIK